MPRGGRRADVPNAVARGLGGRAPRTHICSDLAYVRVGASRNVFVNLWLVGSSTVMFRI